MLANWRIAIKIRRKAPTTSSANERNRRIRARYAKGETVVALAEAFGISQQRVSQILRGKRK